MPESVSDIDRAKLAEIAYELTEAFNHADLDRLMQYYGDTYVDVNLRSPVQSHADRRRYYADLMRRGVRIRARSDEIVVEGDIAFIRGRIEVFTPEAVPGSASPIELRYVEVARKSANGAWRAIWGIDGPVQDWIAAPDNKAEVQAPKKSDSR